MLSLTGEHDKFKDQLGIPYVRFEKDEHFEIHPLQSKAYKHHLIQELFRIYGDKINRGAVESAITIVESEIISTGVTEHLEAMYDSANHHGLVYFIFILANAVDLTVPIEFTEMSVKDSLVPILSAAIIEDWLEYDGSFEPTEYEG